MARRLSPRHTIQRIRRTVAEMNDAQRRVFEIRTGLTAADRTDVPRRASVSFHGDFAAGLRAMDSDPGVRGDFATGTRSASPLVTAGDFATGLRADPAAERVLGDFATGQRADRSDPPDRQRQPTHRSVPALA